MQQLPMLIPRRFLLIVALLCAAATRVMPAAAQPAPAVVAPIQALDQGLLTTMRAAQSTPFPQRFANLTPIVEQAFNFPVILRTVVGLRWSEIPAAQQAELLQAFERFTVATYVSSFNSYDGQQFNLLPQTRSVGAEQVVATQIVPRDGSPTRLDYVMRQGPQGWQAVDVLLDGTISRVAVQRSDFRSLLASGNASRLIDSLRQKVSSLSGGTMQ